MSIRDLVPFARRREERMPVRRERSLGALHDDMDRLFEQFLPDLFGGQAGSVGRLFGLADGLSPGLDSRETDTAVVVTAEMPGVEEKDLNVTLTNQVLTIRGERAGADGEAGRCRYERVMTIDADIDADKVTAVYRNGLLTVTLPKLVSPASRGRHIPIKGG